MLTSESMQSADQLLADRTCSDTKKNYASKIRRATEWFRSNNHANCLNADGTDFLLPIPTRELLEFFGHLCKPATDRKAALVNGDTLEDILKRYENTPDPYSVSVVVGYRSALMDLYTRAYLTMDGDLNKRLKTLLDGYEKTVTYLKKNGLMKISEGKSKILFSGYQMLAGTFMKLLPDARGKRGGNWSTVIFSWTFFVLMWNLMSRSDSVDSLMLTHFDWDEDSLIIEEQGHKADQKGEFKYWKHIYANPLNPDVCPILALAVHLFCSGFQPEAGQLQLVEKKS